MNGEEGMDRLRALRGLVEARGEMYAFLSALYLQPPSEGLMAKVLEEGSLEELARLLGEEAVGPLRGFARQFEGDVEGLRREYDELFHVPLSRYVTPYEAVYRDERVVEGKAMKGLLMGPSTLAAQRAYREAGVGLSAGCKELPDHIGVELAFMDLLCRKEREAWEREATAEARDWLRRERDFLREHLSRWVPALCREICQKARNDFYRGVAGLTREFVRLEMATLEGMEREI